jgi:hypothetical protein
MTEDIRINICILIFYLLKEMNKKLFYFNLSITVFILIFVKTTNAVTVYESSEYSL